MSMIALLVGIVIGVIVAAVVGVQLMRSKMLVPLRSRSSFDDTCAAIEREVEAAEGWSFPIEPFDMYKKLDSKGFPPDGLKRIQLYFVCAPSVAKRVLGEQPKMTAIMPCSWAVYEQDDGSVWLSKMNIGMMSKLFSGEVAAGMSEVARADESFMEKVLA
jgi:uncharacterized protein (DUF302 family)